MIVVLDTIPLILLLKINRIDLLEKLFGDALIPQYRLRWGLESRGR